MGQYEVTAKLWIKLAVDTAQEAEQLAKMIVDEAMYEYAQSHIDTCGENISISKSKTVWTKESK